MTRVATFTKLVGRHDGLASAGTQDGAACKRMAVSMEGRPASDVSCGTCGEAARSYVRR